MSSVQSRYGLLAEFEGEEALARAVRRAREAGYQRMDAYAPHPVPRVAEELGVRSHPLRWLVLVGALVGGALGYFVQYWTNVVLYPYNAGGRPIHSWPAFIPITSQILVFVAVLVGAAAVIILCRLPRLYHPIYNVPEFSDAFEDGFFLCIEAADPRFDPEGTRGFLEGLGPRGVWHVPE